MRLVGKGSAGGDRAAGVADDRRDNRHGLGDRARAVGDGQGGSLGDGVGLAAVGDLGRLRAESGDGGDDLGSVRHIAPGVCASCGSKDGEDGGLHVGGLRVALIMYSKSRQLCSGSAQKCV